MAKALTAAANIKPGMEPEKVSAALERLAETSATYLKNPKRAMPTEEG